VGEPAPQNQLAKVRVVRHKHASVVERSRQQRSVGRSRTSSARSSLVRPPRWPSSIYVWRIQL